MYLIERKPTLSDFFGIAVKTTSRPASGSLPTTQTHQEQEIQPQKSRPAKSTHHFDDHTIRSRLFAHFSTCQGIEKVVKLHSGRLPTCLNLTLCQMLKTNQTLQLNIHIVVIIDKPREQQPTRVCQKRKYPVIACPTFAFLDQSNQREVCSIALP